MPHERILFLDPRLRQDCMNSTRRSYNESFVQNLLEDTADAQMI